MVHPKYIEPFADKTRESFNLSPFLCVCMNNYLHQREFLGELSLIPSPSIIGLLNLYEDFVSEFKSSDSKDALYNGKWYLVPSLACILVHRGSLFTGGLPLGNLPIENKLLSMSNEFGPLTERREVIMQTLESFIDICKVHETEDKNYTNESVNKYIKDAKELAEINKVSALYTYSGIILYSMCLESSQKYVGRIGRI